MERYSFRIVAISFLLSVVTSPALSATKYTITDLGAGAIPSAINAHGDVVGTIALGNSTPEAFVYHPGGTVTGLGQFGGTASWGLGINDSAEIVGTVCMDNTCKETPSWGTHGFWLKQGEVTDLFAATGMVEATSINNSGVILGDKMVEGTYYPFRQIILYDSNNGSITDISQGLQQNNGALYPRALNNLGQALLIETFCADCYIRGYLFSGGTLQLLPQASYFLGVCDINDEGVIVGHDDYSHRGFTSLNDFAVLPDVGALRFAPEAINTEGIMVGNLLSGANLPGFYVKNRQKPKLDEGWYPATSLNGKIEVLQDMLVTSDQWILDEAFDINDKGQIIGYGKKNNEPFHGFILTPANMKKEKGSL